MQPSTGQRIRFTDEIPDAIRAEQVSIEKSTSGDGGDELRIVWPAQHTAATTTAAAAAAADSISATGAAAAAGPATRGERHIARFSAAWLLRYAYAETSEKEEAQRRKLYEAPRIWRCKSMKM